MASFFFFFYILFTLDVRFLFCRWVWSTGNTNPMTQNGLNLSDHCQTCSILSHLLLLPHVVAAIWFSYRCLINLIVWCVLFAYQTYLKYAISFKPSLKCVPKQWGQLFQVHSIIFVKVVAFSTPIRSHSNHQIQRWFQIQRPPYRNPLAISSFIFRLAYIFNC